MDLWKPWKSGLLWYYCPISILGQGTLGNSKKTWIMLKVDKEICRSRVSLTSFLEDVQNVFHRKKSIAVVVRNSLYYKWLHIQCRFLQLMEMLRLWQYADLRPQPCIFLRFSMAHILWQWRKLNGLDFNWFSIWRKNLSRLLTLAIEVLENID